MQQVCPRGNSQALSSGATTNNVGGLSGIVLIFEWRRAKILAHADAHADAHAHADADTDADTDVHSHAYSYTFAYGYVWPFYVWPLFILMPAWQSCLSPQGLV
jgi:hypothetical protein